jgi:hypothetical protein
MYGFYMTVKRSLPILHASIQYLCLLGVVSFLLWVGLLFHVFDATTEANLIYWGALPLNFFLPPNAINLFVISIIEFFLSSSLQPLKYKMQTYVERNTHIEKDAKAAVKVRKGPPPIDKTKRREAILALRIPEETALTPLNLQIKRFTQFNARCLSTEGGYFLIAFQTLEEAVAYTQFILTALEKSEVPKNQYAFALDCVPILDLDDSTKINHLWKDGLLLCHLCSQGEVLCTESFLQLWNKNTKPMGFKFVNGKPVALKNTLETELLGIYLLKGSNTQKTLYTTELK